MDERDFQRIGQLVAQIVDSRLERIDQRFEQMEARFEQMEARFEQIEARIEQMEDRFDRFKREIVAEFNHSLGILSDNIHKEFQVLAEGFAFLSEKVERLEGRIDDVERVLGGRLDVIAIDLAMHRIDPGAHKRGYRIKEDGPEYSGSDTTWDAPIPELLERRKQILEEIDEYYAKRGIERVVKTPDQILREIAEKTARHEAERVAKPRPESDEKPDE